ncbi:uncharacterized protein LOC117912653 [Vitis riparia]|uniref:uncharacterized protein LOC117912653 n=1 Tax=Vitis riparia TaxID=96939 RepID=UPI00155A65D7|nr:uncharacterized protein LOC117912653 [Vitis riparia]
MDAVLQIFKRSICPGTPFFESLAKKPPTTMNDLFRRASKYSMLEDDVRATTQQILVAGQASRSDVERSAKLPDQPRIPAAPKAIINYIHGGPLDEEYDSKRNRQRLLQAASVREHVNSIRPGITGGGPHPIDGTIIFPPVNPTRILQPHHDALILSLEIGDFNVRRILVDPGNSADLLQASIISQMGRNLTGLENPGRILSGFNGATTTSLGDIVLPVQAGPVTLNVQFSVVQDLSPFNVILGRTWLHYMKVIPSTYHQMVSFLTKDGQIDLYGNQLAVRQCYQIAQEVRTIQEDKLLPESTHALDQ